MRTKPALWTDKTKKLLDFDIDAISSINSIISETDCEIVISSDWKLWVGLSEMQNFYTEQGIIKKPIDYTLDYRSIIISGNSGYSTIDISKIRSKEINDYIKYNNLVTFVTIDDIDMKMHIERFIQIDPNIGIKGYVKEIKEFLS